jgi:hypothetical protein
MAATTRMIYDTVSHLIFGSAPNYGYAFSTTQDPTQTTLHTVTLTGLTPGATYYWRAVANQAGGGEVLGKELSFVAPAVQGETVVEEESVENPIFVESPTGQTGTGGVQEQIAGTTTEEEVVEPEIDTNTLGNNTQEEPKQNLFLASIGSFLGDLLGLKCAQINDCCWRLALIITILSAIYIFFREEDLKRKRKLGNHKKVYSDLAIALGIIVILIIWLKCWWLIIPAALFIFWMLKQKFLHK